MTLFELHVYIPTSRCKPRHGTPLLAYPWGLEPQTGDRLGATPQPATTSLPPTLLSLWLICYMGASWLTRLLLSPTLWFLLHLCG